MLDEIQKKKLIDIAIVSGSFLVCAAVLVLLVFASRGLYRNGLKANVQTVLEKSFPDDEYIVGDFVELNSSRSLNTAVFSCAKKKSASKKYAVITRIPGIMGMMPAVFLWTPGENAEFVGYALDNCKADSVFKKEYSAGIIKYWQEDLISALENIEEGR